MGDYVPNAPIDEEAKKRNGNLPGMGGVFNYVNLHMYHYAGNNPVKYTDPDGKWLGFTHKSILNKAFKNEMASGQITNAQMQQLVQASKDIDKGEGQKPENSYMHSMTDGTSKQSVAEAKGERQKFIDQRIAEFVDSDGENFYALGLAAHAVSDEGAPEHNWKSWGGKLFSPAGIKHGIKEFFQGLFAGKAKDKSAESVNAVYQEAMRQLGQKRAESQCESQ
jgi:hypothetical protein